MCSSLHNSFRHPITSSTPRPEWNNPNFWCSAVRYSSWLSAARVGGLSRLSGRAGPLLADCASLAAGMAAELLFELLPAFGFLLGLPSVFYLLLTQGGRDALQLLRAQQLLGGWSTWRGTGFRRAVRPEPAVRGPVRLFRGGAVERGPARPGRLPAPGRAPQPLGLAGRGPARAAAPALPGPAGLRHLEPEAQDGEQVDASFRSALLAVHVHPSPSVSCRSAPCT